MVQSSFEKIELTACIKSFCPVWRTELRDVRQSSWVEGAWHSRQLQPWDVLAKKNSPMQVDTRAATAGMARGAHPDVELKGRASASDSEKREKKF